MPKREQLLVRGAAATAAFTLLLGAAACSEDEGGQSGGGTVTVIGTWGGAEWSGAAFDPETGILYVNANEVPSIQNVVPRATSTEGLSPAEAGRVVFLANGCAGCHGADLKGDQSYPSLVTRPFTLDEVARFTREGGQRMPKFPFLDAIDVQRLHEYLGERRAAQ